ncbi:hypothetical protein AMATHDRAFT_60135 [Amanita thiersii Skay4041]|uniref:Uncharacterized protein n=1 Tax=Amanita thiersii Skay4041 TaxID=703135 RepID=A0A2A9NTB6_9AGAR|nr:hypothetical protein AMATHDRAFT_60135 [Amanita thiersii Skay4041]
MIHTRHYTTLSTLSYISSKWKTAKGDSSGSNIPSFWIVVFVYPFSCYYSPWAETICAHLTTYGVLK